MTAVEFLVLAPLFAGVALCLGELPWFRDAHLSDRLRPYTGAGPVERHSQPAVLGIRNVLGPIAQDLGARLSRLLGVSTDLRTRLDRAGRTTDPEDFRLRQLAHAVLALFGAGLLVLATRPGLALGGVLLIGGPSLTLLIHEQLLTRDAEERSRRLEVELPVLAEQLGLLVSAGYSVTGALTRLAGRSSGIAKEDLQRVLLRIRHGVPEHTALAEWAELTDVDAVARLTAVLSLHGETADLGQLISEEARSARAEAHRQLLEVIERRAQLVWIPVTVATLVPGLVFLAVPFMSAMAQVTGS